MMMKASIVAPSLVALALAALLPLPALADPYVMLGGATGSVDLSSVQDIYGSGATVNDNFSRVIVGMGGRVNSNLGVEATYMSNVDNDVHNNVAKDNLAHDGFQLALLGYLPVARNVDLFLKGSANLIHTDYTATDPAAFPAGPYEEKHDRTYFGFGGGVEFNIAPNLTVRGTVERIQLQNVVNSSILAGNSSDFNVDQASLDMMLFF
jgi:opacity protein-like surface antigen